jgi:hypothetical protein
MPTTLPAASLADFTQIRDRTGLIGKRIALGLLITWALSMLLFAAVVSFGARAATVDSFELIATF